MLFHKIYLNYIPIIQFFFSTKLTLTAGWLAMAASPKNVKNFYLFDPDIYKIRIGYLAINIIASGISIFIFAVSVMAPKLIFYCEFITGVISFIHSNLKLKFVFSNFKYFFVF
jgi:hypothetical protein